MAAALTPTEEGQLLQTIEMFEVITQSQPMDYQSLEILKEAYFKLGRERDVMGISKRIAQAYVQLGQLSSAILEYESILQRFPDDPDVQAALLEIENKANSLSGSRGPSETDFVDRMAPVAPAVPGARGGARPLVTEVDDGKATMQKLFSDARLLSPTDFSMYWTTPSMAEPPKATVEPFIQILADKQILPLEKSLKLLCDKSRLGFIPFEKYDIDVELARSFPKEVCQRWCILPFDRMSKSVLVATVNPFNKQAARDLELSTKNRVIWYMVNPSELMKMIKKVHR